LISEKDKLLVFLSMYEISVKKQEQILEMIDDYSVSSLLRNNDVVRLLNTDEFHKMVEQFDQRAFDSAVSNMENSGIKIVTIFSDEYPAALIDLPERPTVLYAKGDLTLLDEKCIAIVGTRTPTNYGKLTTEKFAKELSQCGFVIVSGLCYGVDEIAHKATLQAGGKTIAVVGSGFNNIYPAINTGLANEIAEKGLILSEYPPSFRAKRYTFPLRNRIVAGLSNGVLITEAGIKSGTLHTKEYALEYGKDIFAIPGNIGSSQSDLPNSLIRSGQAECALSPEDIISFYGMKKQAREKKMVTLNFEEQIIVDLLKNSERDFDYLAENSKIPVNILNSCLTTLEIRGLIRKLPGKFYALL